MAPLNILFKKPAKQDYWTVFGTQPHEGGVGRLIQGINFVSRENEFVIRKDTTELARLPEGDSYTTEFTNASGEEVQVLFTHAERL